MTHQRIRPSEVRQARRFTAPFLSDLTEEEKDWRLELQRDGEADQAHEQEQIEQEQSA